MGFDQSNGTSATMAGIAASIPGPDQWTLASPADRLKIGLENGIYKSYTLVGAYRKKQQVGERDNAENGETDDFITRYEFHYETDDGKEFKTFIDAQQKMTFPSFKVLLDNYPELDPNGMPFHPSNDKGFENQCAARMSYCLMNSGVDFSSYNGKKSTEGYARGAKALGNWLRTNFETPKYLTNETFKTSAYSNQSGILLKFNSNDQSGFSNMYYSNFIEPNQSFEYIRNIMFGVYYER